MGEPEPKPLKRALRRAYRLGARNCYICSRCKREKPRAEFPERPVKTAGQKPVGSWCLRCLAAYKAVRRGVMTQCPTCAYVIELVVGLGICRECALAQGVKACSGCGLIYPSNYFYEGRWRCPECHNGGEGRRPGEDALGTA